MREYSKFEDGPHVGFTAGRWQSKRVAVEESVRKGRQKERWQQKLRELQNMGKLAVTWLSLESNSGGR